MLCSFEDQRQGAAHARFAQDGLTKSMVPVKGLKPYGGPFLDWLKLGF